MRNNNSKSAELIAPNHRFIANTHIYKETSDELVTFTPKNHEQPMFFTINEEVSIVYNTHEYINYFNVRFERMDTLDDEVLYVFKIVTANQIKNERAENRENVEFQAVISDYYRVNVATILDISESGMKVESVNPIKSQFIEIFYDIFSNNKVKRGKILWKKEEHGKYYYGISTTF